MDVLSHGDRAKWFHGVFTVYHIQLIMHLYIFVFMRIVFSWFYFFVEN